MIMPVWLTYLIPICIALLVGAWCQRQYDIAERKLDAEIAAATHRADQPTRAPRCLFTVDGVRCEGWSGHPNDHFRVRRETGCTAVDL